MLEELASRGLDNLLDYAFATLKTPPEKQTGIRTIIALRKLGDPGAKLTAPQRDKLVSDIVKGIELALPTMHDPKLMMRQASDLITAGVERDVNTLEYWGDNPRTQANLRPVVNTVVKLLERCVAEAKRASEQAANKIRSPDDKSAVQRYEQLERLATEAEYTKYMTDYYLVLAIDRADPRRKQIATKAIEYLKQFDTPDQPIRGRVRNRIGKLALTSGDLDNARQMFDLVIKASADDFKPPPDVSQQYEARYFRAVTDLVAQKPDDAMKGLEALESWQKTNLPNPDVAPNPEAKTRARDARQGASAAAAMLRFRILSLKSDLASGADRKMFDDQAQGVLFALLREQPSLQPIIYDQLMSKQSPDAKTSDMDALLLQALVRRGEGEVRRTEGRADTRAIERGLAAARELLTRPNVDPATTESAQLLVGFFLDKLDKKPDAVTSFLDYIEKDPKRPNAELALDNAQWLIGQLRRDKPDDEQVARLYDRFLPIAVAPPFERKQFAYEYARRLQLQNKPDQALAYFELVPNDDKRALAAHFFQTVALQQKLDAMKADDSQRPALVTKIQGLAEQVNASIGQAVRGATSDEERNSYRSMLARTTLLAAEMARTEQNDPKRALKLLDGFERKIDGLPDANRRTTDALLVRVQALMAVNDYTAATNQLVQLLDREPARGGRIVYDLLQKLNEALDKAQAAGNEALVRTIANNRAKLTGFLVSWARENANPAVKNLAYGYAVFDAEVQRFAAVHEPDASARQAGLTRALELFTKLDTPENLPNYLAALPPDQQPTTNPTEPQATPTYDPAVILGIARTQFDLGHWTEARDGFSRLLSDRRLGPPISVVDDQGQPREIENDNYWEAVLKLIRSNVALNSGVEESKRYLKEQLVRWGETRVGGKRWKDDFKKLRAELIGDFDPNAIPTTAPTTDGAG